MTKTILTIIGSVFIVLGLVGFAAPGLGGTHLSPVHNLIHLVSGGLALWFGLGASLSGARTFSWVFGMVYGLLGVAGMILGQPGVSTAHQAASDPKLWTVIPNVLELGQNDHILHIIVGAAFVVAALMTRSATRPAGAV